MGILDGAHSGWAYKQLEAAVEGIVDFKVEDQGEESRDLMRIRTLRRVAFDRKWHEPTMSEKSEVTLRK
jgi:KaiC/GvpD/RAD55 family RecA-like ATPase